MSAAEHKFQKRFPKAKEKLLGNTKCSLYLELHHPGTIYSTATSLYFFTTKNLSGSDLPNPLALSVPLKEITQIQLTGIDGITMQKDEDSLLFSGFQNRKAFFTQIEKLYKDARGSKAKVLTETGTEIVYGDFQEDAKKESQVKLEGLPFVNDLGVLCKNWQFVDAQNQVIWDGSSFPKMANIDRARELVFFLNKKLAFDEEEEKKKTQRWNEYFSDYDETKLRVSVFIPTLQQHLKESFGEDHKVVKCLKACIHPITSAIGRIRLNMGIKFPFKDVSWTVQVTFGAKDLCVHHKRIEQCSGFQLRWEVVLTYSYERFELQTAKFNITDLVFDSETKEPIRYEVEELLKTFLPDPNSILLPSFADVSSQKLTALPAPILDLTNLQTLYIHNNSLTTLPKEFSKLQQLQVFFAHQNQFSEIPDILFQIKSLRELHLGRNRISQIPKNIDTMNLRVLSLSYNLLKEIPDEVGNMAQLRALYLHNNYLATLPKSLLNLKNLAKVQVHNNQNFKAPLADFGPHDGVEALFEILKKF